MLAINGAKSANLSYLCGATTNNGDVAAASDLYQDGVGCGACYQERCMNSQDCSDEDVTVITDKGSNDRTDFIMNKKAFCKMAQSTYAASSLLPQGFVDIEHREVMQSSLKSNLNQQYQAALAAGLQSVGSGDALKQPIVAISAACAIPSTFRFPYPLILQQFVHGQTQMFDHLEVDATTRGTTTIYFIS